MSQDPGKVGRKTSRDCSSLECGLCILTTHSTTHQDGWRVATVIHPTRCRYDSPDAMHVLHTQVPPPTHRAAIRKRSGMPLRDP